MARTRTFDPTVALTTAAEIFAAKGYSETSMEDLVQATGVSRYGLYGTFGNKRELFEAALERFAESLGKASFLKLLEPDAELDQIRSIFYERAEDMCNVRENKGCLFIHTAMEMAPQDEELRDVLQKFMKRMTKAFAIGLETMRARGEVKRDLDIRTSAELLTSTMFGLAVLGRTGFPKETLHGVIETTIAALQD
ncbi:MAG: TetR/AcrR family transcriptional regulator [Pseudomonadota bacterium]